MVTSNDLVLRNPSLNELVWGCSSVGRAVALQAIGQEFESPQLHQLEFDEKLLDKPGV